MSTLLFALAPLLAAAAGDPWVVIVAGSNGYQNYRHQADACHAYQVALNNGVPKGNIITMLYDDIANNEGNPFMGKLFNTVDGSDVYGGCVIDYTGMATSMETFFRVLHGNATAQVPRVLGSGPDDNVFIYYTDHGAPGYVTFPSGPAMHATDLSDALVTMQQRGRYGKLLIYMDACNTGSMFAGGLLKAPNALAVAAALATEESYAAYCPPYDKVISENNREAFSCLGDVMSIQWMLDSARGGGGAAVTVGSQIAVVANRTLNGHVLNRDHNSHLVVFGDMSIKDMPVTAFQGPKAAAALSTTAAAAPVQQDAGVPRTSSRDVPLLLARHRVATAPAEGGAFAAAERALASVLASRARADDRFHTLATRCGDATWVEREVSQSFFMDREVVGCYKNLLAHTAKAWGAMDDYSLKYSGLLANLCGELGAAAVQCVVNAV
eukprot:Hpha_TRINITY_DN15322_c2_g8::TRINITY_DN15322_c2_g8_i1::g.91493::m.91493/K01369/LGMN; legumain